ncbi:MAG: ATP-binding cassette domain-containing protein [Peptococcaceae bacterium]|nr:ATP-binding cassette domain-containing protein [Peptococcaceae bacterium]MDH7524413.1 ATP-binding cassette domain-containing protein [Peptococcaceae bacterium]
MALEIDNVSHSYGERRVLKGISFRFDEGIIYGIIGPNGAGKSTLLRIMAGMEKPEEGHVFWEGRLLEEPNPQIACVWQKHYLFQSTVSDNILYGLKIRRWPRREQEKRLAYLLENFRLAELAKQPVGSLSGGETARVALARTVAPRPRLLVLDEPAASLDPFHTLLLENSLRWTCREEGMTVIIVTHDMFQAKRIADETLFIRDGVLEEHGPTEQVFGNPRSAKTRKFISGEL